MGSESSRGADQPPPRLRRRPAATPSLQAVPHQRIPEVPLVNDDDVVSLPALGVGLLDLSAITREGPELVSAIAHHQVVATWRDTGLRAPAECSHHRRELLARSAAGLPGENERLSGELDRR